MTHTPLLVLRTRFFLLSQKAKPQTKYDTQPLVSWGNPVPGFLANIFATWSSVFRLRVPAEGRFAGVLNRDFGLWRGSSCSVCGFVALWLWLLCSCQEGTSGLWLVGVKGRDTVSRSRLAFVTNKPETFVSTHSIKDTKNHNTVRSVFFTQVVLALRLDQYPVVHAVLLQSKKNHRKCSLYSSSTSCPPLSLSIGERPRRWFFHYFFPDLKIFFLTLFTARRS